MKSTFLFVSLLVPVPIAYAAVPTAGNQAKPAAKIKLVTMSAGRVGDAVITTREVIANSFIEDALFRPSKEKKVYQKAISDRTFVQEVTAVLLETAISKEGKELPLAKVTAGDFQAAKDAASKKLKAISQWRDLRLTDTEFDSILRSKLSAKKFLEFKVESASLPISDADSLEYYKNNKFKFENVPYEGLKGNIKAFLRKKQIDDRLREWFEVLKIKYAIRNQLAEKGRS